MSDDTKILEDIGQYKYGFHDRDDNYAFKSRKGLDREVVEQISHMKGEPQTMQRGPRYDDVVAEVKAFLAEAVRKARFAGIGADRIVVDPGFGFGKTVEHNLILLRELRQFSELGVPVLVGLSRKSTVGTITGRPAGERLAGSLALALLALERGATILRVHDVKETKDVVAVWQAVRK